MSQTMNIQDYGSGNVVRFPEGAPPAIKEKCLITFKGANNKIVFGDEVTGKRLMVDVNGDNNKILIGKACVLNGAISMKGNDNTVSLGKFTTMVSARIECEHGTEITLGVDCMLSKDIVIRSGDSHSIIDLNTGERINYSASVAIGDHVWIGYGVSIGKGAVVQRNTIIGTGSFVNKHITEGNVILAGTPAKVVKRDVIWDRRYLTGPIPASHLEALKARFLFDESTRIG